VTGSDEQFFRLLPRKIRFDDLEAQRDLKVADEPRVLAMQHADALLKAYSFDKFDVFLSYAHREKEEVKPLKDLLVAFPLKVWFDDDELRPGVPWQRLVESGIRNSSSVVVAVGSSGRGPWQREEWEAALQLAVDDGLAVIPVLLPAAGSEPELPLFLRNRTWVDLREGLTSSGIARLVWGITGEKPEHQHP
jgi:hypothetical protein